MKANWNRHVAVTMLAAMVTGWLMCAPVSAAMEKQVLISVNGQSITESAILIDGRALIPLDLFTKTLGNGFVHRENALGSVTISNDSRLVALTLGSTEAILDGKATTLDVPPQLIDNEIYIPARFVGEVLGMNVTWDAASKTVQITDKKWGPLQLSLAAGGIVVAGLLIWGVLRRKPKNKIVMVKRVADGEQPAENYYASH